MVIVIICFVLYMVITLHHIFCFAAIDSNNSRRLVTPGIQHYSFYKLSKSFISRIIEFNHLTHIIFSSINIFSQFFTARTFWWLKQEPNFLFVMLLPRHNLSFIFISMYTRYRSWKIHYAQAWHLTWRHIQLKISIPKTKEKKKL